MEEYKSLTISLLILVLSGCSSPGEALNLTDSLAATLTSSTGSSNLNNLRLEQSDSNITGVISQTTEYSDVSSSLIGNNITLRADGYFGFESVVLAGTATPTTISATGSRSSDTLTLSAIKQ